MRTSKPSYNSVWIGRVGETGATDVVFPLIEGWDDINENTYGLIVVRAGETTPYPCPVTVEEDGVHWTPNSGDLLYAGKGKAELILTGDSGEIVKSVIYQTVVGKALTDDTTDPPAPWESYVETVLAAGAKAENMTATASVDNTSGTPEVVVTKTETAASYNLDFAFTGLKGASGGGRSPAIIEFPSAMWNALMQLRPQATGMATMPVDHANFAQFRPYLTDAITELIEHETDPKVIMRHNYGTGYEYYTLVSWFVEPVSTGVNSVSFAMRRSTTVGTSFTNVADYTFIFNATLWGDESNDHGQVTASTISQSI